MIKVISYLLNNFSFLNTFPNHLKESSKENFSISTLFKENFPNLFPKNFYPPQEFLLIIINLVVFIGKFA